MRAIWNEIARVLILFYQMAVFFDCFNNVTSFHKRRFIFRRSFKYSSFRSLGYYHFWQRLNAHIKYLVPTAHLYNVLTLSLIIQYLTSNISQCTNGVVYGFASVRAKIHPRKLPHTDAQTIQWLRHANTSWTISRQTWLRWHVDINEQGKKSRSVEMSMKTVYNFEARPQGYKNFSMLN